MKREHGRVFRFVLPLVLLLYWPNVDWQVHAWPKMLGFGTTSALLLVYSQIFQ